MDTFDRLKPLENLVSFIPTGASKEGKAPFISEWSKHLGVTVQELQEQFPQAKSVGVITQPLLCFDFDGETATNHAVLNDRDPDYVNTRRINTTTDPHRWCDINGLWITALRTRYGNEKFVTFGVGPHNAPHSLPSGFGINADRLLELMESYLKRYC